MICCAFKVLAGFAVGSVVLGRAPGAAGDDLSPVVDQWGEFRVRATTAWEEYLPAALPMPDGAPEAAQLSSTGGGGYFEKEL